MAEYSNQLPVPLVSRSTDGLQVNFRWNVLLNQDRPLQRTNSWAQRGQCKETSLSLQETQLTLFLQKICMEGPHSFLLSLEVYLELFNRGDGRG